MNTKGLARVNLALTAISAYAPSKPRRTQHSESLRFQGSPLKSARELTFEQYWTEVLNNPRLAMSFAELTQVALGELPLSPQPALPSETLAIPPIMKHPPTVSPLDRFIGPVGTGKIPDTYARLGKAVADYMDATARKTSDLRFLTLPTGSELMSWVDNPSVRYQLKWVNLPDGLVPGQSDYMDERLLETPLHLFSQRYPVPHELQGGGGGLMGLMLTGMSSMNKPIDADPDKPVPGSFKFPEQRERYLVPLQAAAKRVGLRSTPQLYQDNLVPASRYIFERLFDHYDGNWNALLSAHVRAVEVPIKAITAT